MSATSNTLVTGEKPGGTQREESGGGQISGLAVRAAELEAGIVFVATCLVYLLGAGRSLDYDSSVTVAHFIATPSLLDPFRHQEGYNNHPLFSFADHILYTLGGQDVAALRVLPVVFGAAAVALLSWYCARRWGILSGAAAAIVTASNPLFAYESRSVRGYSLVTLCAVGSTILFSRLSRSPRRSLEIFYVAVLAIGVGTHLYGLLVIPLHVAVVISRRQLSRRWVVRWCAAILLGAAPYALIARPMIPSGARVFSASFPLDLAKQLLGGHLVAIVATLLLIGIAVVIAWPPRRSVLWVLGTLLGMILALWLVVQPIYLFPRFFMWIFPAVGLIAAWGVARHRLLFLLAAACLASTIIYGSGNWNEDPLPTREAARVLSAAATRGLQPCVLWVYGESLGAYRPPPFREVKTPRDLAGCGLVLQLDNAAGGPVQQARARYPYHAVLKGQQSFEVYTRAPLGHLIPDWQELGRA